MKKKGFLTTSLATVMLYFGVVLLIIVFFFVLKLSKEDRTVKIGAHVSDTDKNYRLLHFLRMPLEVDGIKMNMAELIALQKMDDSKKPIAEQNIRQFIGEYSDVKRCSVLCIDSKKFSSEGCKGRLHSCPLESIKIPSYGDKPIEIAFNPDTLALSYTDIRVGRIS